MKRVAAAAACLILMVSCGGDGGEARDDERPTGVARMIAGTPAAAPGRALLRFAVGARRGDVAAMWRELSVETRASFGPTLREFAAARGPQLELSFRPIQGPLRLLLSRTVSGRVAVAAIGADRVVEGEVEAFSYAAALVREQSGWRVELGALVFDALDPGVLDETDARPQLGVRASAGGRVRLLAAWLDGRPLRLERVERTTFTARAYARALVPLRPGRHDVVVVAATGAAAGAVAWPFVVER